MSRFLSRSVTLWIFTVAGALAMLSLEAEAGSLVSTESPIGFFTNVASRLLISELGQDLSHIQIYPTNQYTPALHRLLQLTANLYDCTTNRAAVGPPYPPSVFRPLFAGETNSEGSYQMWITGYEELTNADFVLNPPRFHDLSDTNDLYHIESHDMIYGVPVILGVKQGFPNFNEFAMDTVVQVIRRLQFLRPPSTAPVNSTNQMFVLGISNVFGVEAWNSYSNPFPHELKLFVTTDIRGWMTNEVPGQGLLNPPTGYSTNFQSVVDLPRGRERWEHVVHQPPGQLLRR